MYKVQLHNYAVLVCQERNEGGIKTEAIVFDSRESLQEKKLTFKDILNFIDLLSITVNFFFSLHFNVSRTHSDVFRMTFKLILKQLKESIRHILLLN